MRTTVDLPPALHRRARELAKSRGQSLSAVLAELTARGLSLVQSIRDSHRCEFWPDVVSYVDVGLSHVHGHRQATDAYLAGLAAAKGGRLATLDRRLAAQIPGFVTLVPE